MTNRYVTTEQATVRRDALMDFLKRNRDSSYADIQGVVTQLPPHLHASSNLISAIKEELGIRISGRKAPEKKLKTRANFTAKFIESRREFLKENLAAKLTTSQIQEKAKERWPDYPIPSSGAIQMARIRMDETTRTKRVPRKIAAKISTRDALKKGTVPVIQSHIPSPMMEAVEALKTVMKDFEYTEVHVGPNGTKLRQYIEQEF